MLFMTIKDFQPTLEASNIFDLLSDLSLKSQMTTTLKVQPILTLRKVDPLRVVKEYEAGNYARLPAGLTPLPGPNEPNTQNSSLPSLSALGAATQFSEVKNLITSSFRDKNNVTIQIIAPTANENSTKVCSWCGLAFQYQAVGIPITYEIREDNLGNQTHLYTIVGSYNTFECAYADFKHMSGKNVIFRNSQYQDSESLLRMLAYSVTGSTEIKEALPRSLLNVNGGPMTATEYLNDHHQYTQISNILIVQASIQYFRT